MNDPLPQTAGIKSRGYGAQPYGGLVLPRSRGCISAALPYPCLLLGPLLLCVSCCLDCADPVQAVYCALLFGPFLHPTGKRTAFTLLLIPAFANPVALYSLTLSFSNPCVLVHLGYCHRIPGTGRLTNNRNLFLVYLVAGKSKIKMLTDLVSCEGPPPSS